MWCSAACRLFLDYGAKIDRERVLSEAEIKTLWQALPAAKMGKRNELAIWIQLATGCRIGELMQARKEHINLVKGTWRIPPRGLEKRKRTHDQSIHFCCGQFRRAARPER